MRKTMAYLMVVALVAMVFSAVPVSVSAGWTGDITIHADGTVFPADAPVHVKRMKYSLTDDVLGPITVQKSGITLCGEGYTLEGSGSGDGVSLSGVSGVTVKDLNIKGFSNGIYLSSSNGNTIKENTLSDCDDDCIDLKGSNGNIIKENMISNSGVDISGGTIDENFANGIFLEDSDSNTIKENTVSYIEDDAIYIVYSSGNTIKDNSVSDSYWGIIVEYSSNNNIVRGNKISDIYDIGIGITLNSNDNTVKDNTISDIVWIGIYVAGNSNGNTVSENTVADNTGGIWVFFSSGNTLSANTISGIGWESIRLLASGGNTISGNMIKDNYRGILVISNPSGNGNVITENTISKSEERGIILGFGTNSNTVYHNNVIRNGIQAMDNGIGNMWDDGAEGNYWSDYKGKDKDHDGIGDTPYTGILGVAGSVDNYPLMKPYN